MQLRGQKWLHAITKKKLKKEKIAHEIIPVIGGTTSPGAAIACKLAQVGRRAIIGFRSVESGSKAARGEPAHGQQRAGLWR